MEAFGKIGGIIMEKHEKYEKPCLVSQAHVNGIIPLAALSGPALAGLASVAGLAVGMAATSSSRGSNDVFSFRANMVLQA